MIALLVTFVFYIVAPPSRSTPSMDYEHFCHDYVETPIVTSFQWLTSQPLWAERAYILASSAMLAGDTWSRISQVLHLPRAWPHEFIRALTDRCVARCVLLVAMSLMVAWQGHKRIMGVFCLGMACIYYHEA